MGNCASPTRAARSPSTARCLPGPPVGVPDFGSAAGARAGPGTDRGDKRLVVLVLFPGGRARRAAAGEGEVVRDTVARAKIRPARVPRPGGLQAAPAGR